MSLSDPQVSIKHCWKGPLCMNISNQVTDYQVTPTCSTYLHLFNYQASYGSTSLQQNTNHFSLHQKQNRIESWPQLQLRPLQSPRSRDSTFKFMITCRIIFPAPCPPVWTNLFSPETSISQPSHSWAGRDRNCLEENLDNLLICNWMNASISSPWRHRGEYTN